MIDLHPSGRVKILFDDRWVRLRLAKIRDLKVFGLMFEAILAEIGVGEDLVDLAHEDNRFPEWYRDVLKEMGGLSVEVEDLPAWMIGPASASALLAHWQNAPMCPWDAVKGEGQKSPLTPSWEQNKTDDASMVTIEPSNLPGMMGQLAFLYRMMAVAKYRVADVDELEVWQCAVALGVDAKMQPMTAGGEIGAPTPRRIVDDAVMSTPTEVLDIDAAMLDGRTAFAFQET